jgi:putative heme-binding domain-containing protein
VLQEVVTPKPAADLLQLSVDEVVRLQGDAARGRDTASRCLVCHTIAGAGAEFGPALDGWGRGKSDEVIALALVQPGAEVAQGYDGMEIKTKDGVTIEGLLITDADPLMMRSMGGVTQRIPADRVASRRRLLDSMMMSATQLGLTAQDVADIVAFLREN